MAETITEILQNTGAYQLPLYDTNPPIGLEHPGTTWLRSVAEYYDSFPTATETPLPTLAPLPDPTPTPTPYPLYEDDVPNEFRETPTPTPTPTQTPTEFIDLLPTPTPTPTVHDGVSCLRIYVTETLSDYTLQYLSMNDVTHESIYAEEAFDLNTIYGGVAYNARISALYTAFTLTNRVIGLNNPALICFNFNTDSNGFNHQWLYGEFVVNINSEYEFTQHGVSDFLVPTELSSCPVGIELTNLTDTYLAYPEGISVTLASV